MEAPQDGSLHACCHDLSCTPGLACFTAQVKSLDSWTHAYSFWEGVPVDSRRAFARLFCASKTLQVTLASRETEIWLKVSP